MMMHSCLLLTSDVMDVELRLTDVDAGIDANDVISLWRRYQEMNHTSLYPSPGLLIL